MTLQTSTLKKSVDTFLDDKVAGWPPRNRALLALLILLLPVLLFYFLSFRPQSSEIARLTKQQKALQEEIDLLVLKTKNIGKFRTEKAITEQNFATVSVLLPQKKEIPSLLTNISSLGTSSGLDFLSFRPKNETPQDFYAEIPVDIKVRGLYHNVGVFLDKINKLPRIVTVSNIVMASPTVQGDQVLLDTSFNLVTYRFLTEEERKAQRQNKTKKKKG